MISGTNGSLDGGGPCSSSLYSTFIHLCRRLIKFTHRVMNGPVYQHANALAELRWPTAEVTTMKGFCTTDGHPLWSISGLWDSTESAIRRRWIFTDAALRQIRVVVGGGQRALFDY